MTDRTIALLCLRVIRQAEVIQAQRANLDAARKALAKIQDLSGDWRILEIARAALEGIEPEEQPMAK